MAKAIPAIIHGSAAGLSFSKRALAWPSEGRLLPAPAQSIPPKLPLASALQFGVITASAEGPCHYGDGSHNILDASTPAPEGMLLAPCQAAKPQWEWADRPWVTSSAQAFLFSFGFGLCAALFGELSNRQANAFVKFAVIGLNLFISGALLVYCGLPLRALLFSHFINSTVQFASGSDLVASTTTSLMTGLSMQAAMPNSLNDWLMTAFATTMSLAGKTAGDFTGVTLVKVLNSPPQGTQPKSPNPPLSALTVYQSLPKTKISGSTSLASQP